MSASSILFAGDKKAAALLDMNPAEFRGLVDDGVLPEGVEIAPGYVRWRVADLAAIKDGTAMDDEDFQV